MSEAVETAIDRLLGSPTTCPHGNPIPGSAYTSRPTPGRCRPSASATASPSGASPRSSSSRPGLLEYLEASSLQPGHAGTITAASPDGTMTVEIDGRHVGVGAFASARILVTA